MTFDLTVIALIFGLIWIFVLSTLFWRLSSHYNNLTKGVSKEGLQAILEALLKNIKTARADIDFLQKRCDTIEKESLLHIQKIGLLRFNPFKDTGGDQSFILALLDGKQTGIVISGLYSRLGTRWYAKKVHAGKGIDHELSAEEKKAIDCAVPTSNLEKN